jgi:hypothetical protein
LFVVADGPRVDHPTDAENCKNARSVLDKVDWKCEVVKNYSEVNLGSYKRNSSGLNWLFDNVEEAIILEDDCIPDLTFFTFCNELLDRYRQDTRIGAICGNNFLPNTPYGRYSYFFSTYPLLWGWAGWRRTWQLIDPIMKNWPEFRVKGLTNIFPDRRLRKYWDYIFQSINVGRLKPAWDYHFMLTCFMQNMLSVVPNVNLVMNIGFDEQGTHCVNKLWPCANIQKHAMKFPLAHPSYIVPDRDADKGIHFNRFNVPLYKQYPLRVINKIDRIFGISNNKTCVEDF